MHTYLQLVLERFDCYGTWLPGAPIHVGEIGELIGGGSFSHTGEIEDRIEGAGPAIDHVPEPPKQALVGATVSRSGGGSVRTHEIVQALGDASASLTLNISKHNSAALILDRVTRHQYADEQVVRRLMRMLWDRGQIGPDEVVVTYVLEAASGFVAAASSRETQVEGEGGASLGFHEFKLAKVNGRLAIVSGTMSETMSVADEEPLTPLYRALVFRGSRPWFNFWKRHYTVETLVEASSSLRAMGRRAAVPRAHVEARIGDAFAAGRSARARVPFPGVDAIGVVSSSRPSLALAEQALAELANADAGLAPPELDAEPAFGIDALDGVRVRFAGTDRWATLAEDPEHMDEQPDDSAAGRADDEPVELGE